MVEEERLIESITDLEPEEAQALLLTLTLYLNEAGLIDDTFFSFDKEEMAQLVDNYLTISRKMEGLGNQG